MTRRVLRAPLAAGVLLLVSPFLAAGPEDDKQEKVKAILAVQSALVEGKEQLQRNNYRAAVLILERELHRLGDADRRDYLNALAEAYRGYVRELQPQPGRAKELALYVERLAVLDPGSRLDQKPAALAAIASGVTPPPAKQPADAAPPVTARGKIDDDPFAEANRVPGVDARALVERAEKDFNDRRYPSAGRLYQQAHAVDPKATDGCLERWAYCKLSGVVDALNQPAVTAAAAQDLEREVRQAVSMAPKLDAYGKTLLRTLQDRAASPTAAVGTVERPAEATIEIRQAANQGSWEVLETSHFRVLHNQPREAAEKAARLAEQTRLAMSRKWFGDDGETWKPRCDLYLHATAQDYSRATGVPTSSPGHSTIRNEGERVASRRIDVHCDDANVFIGVLPHETTHVVLAGRFDGKVVPRWADEGMAVLTEPRDRIERHLRNLPQHYRDRQLFGAGQLLQMSDYPDPRYIGPFYAQSVSMVEYLCSLKGTQEFTLFLRDGLKGGYEPALQKHYGIQGFSDLEKRWVNAALSERSAAAPSER